MWLSFRVGYGECNSKSALCLILSPCPHTTSASGQASWQHCISQNTQLVCDYVTGLRLFNHESQLLKLYQGKHSLYQGLFCHDQVSLGKFLEFVNL